MANELVNFHVFFGTILVGGLLKFNKKMHHILVWDSRSHMSEEFSDTLVLMWASNF